MPSKPIQEALERKITPPTKSDVRVKREHIPAEVRGGRACYSLGPHACVQGRNTFHMAGKPCGLRHELNAVASQGFP